MTIEPVPPEQTLRLCVLGDFDGAHTRSWLRYFVQRGHEVHAVSYYPLPTRPRACVSTSSGPARPRPALPQRARAGGCRPARNGY